jgi:type IV secretory pathway VirB6-like protein
VPSTWNHLRLDNQRTGKRARTTLECKGRSGFYNYVQWLQFVVDYIIKENREVALDFQGSISWNWDRKCSDDRGTLTVKVHSPPTKATCRSS